MHENENLIKLIYKNPTRLQLTIFSYSLHSSKILASLINRNSRDNPPHDKKLLLQKTS